MDTSLDKVRGWHAKASDVDYVAKFIFEYLSFITCITNFIGLDITDKKNAADRSLIQSFKRNEYIKTLYLELVTRNGSFQGIPVCKEWSKTDDAEKDDAGLMTLHFVEDYELLSSWHEIAIILNKAHIQKEPFFYRQNWWNCSEPHPDKCTERTKAIIRNKEDWVNMVEFWYSLRNNLFHGIINPKDEKYERLIKKGYITLKPLVEILICIIDEETLLPNNL